MACIPPVMVQIVDVGELAVEKVIILIREQGKRIANGNVLRVYAGRVDELAQQSQDHLGRGVHVVQHAHQIVRLWVDPFVADDATHKVHFDGDLLPLPISGIAVAVCLVEVLY